ncbi:MAG: hypothetical protein COA58_00970 [Bacteroidetes bacterium]|nr:MAG: hypothetical protein COA58_00970 [Bacteroidota bacterium]
MKKTLITLLLFVIASSSFAQKVKVKKGAVTVDGVAYANWEKDDIVRQNRLVKNTNGDLLLLAVTRTFQDNKAISESNPKGNVSYYEILKPGSNDILFEYQGFAKHLFKAFYNGKVINEDGTLNEDNLKTVSIRIGKEFSRQREKMDININISH